MKKIAHIINPVVVNKSSDLFPAQPITFETMRRAKKFAKGIVDVELYSTCYPEDDSIVPDYFIKTPCLERSVMDVGDFRKFRKLPLVRDIFDRLYYSTNAEFLIYTNVDIALMPYFYIVINSIIESGYDAFVINRRTIPKELKGIDKIPLMYAHMGKKHPGYDCFIFKRNAYLKYELGTACIGANWIGRVIISNTIFFSDNFKVFEDKHLTFHIGDDRSWKTSENIVFDIHNENVLLDILLKFRKKKVFNRKPYLGQFLKNIKINQKNNKILIRELKQKNTVNLQFKGSIYDLYHCKYMESNRWENGNSLKLSQYPIFIVGYPCSGMTFLQYLLCTQDNVVMIPEVHFFNKIKNKLKVSKDRIQPECIEYTISLIRSIIPFSKNLERLTKLLVDKRTLSPKMLFENIVLDELYQKFGEKNFRNVIWVENTPDNIYFLDVIFRFYPYARVIFIVRNPERAIISRKNYLIHKKNGKWSIKKHVLLWKKNINIFKQKMKGREQHLILVRYEDLIEDVEREMSRICSALSISFNKKKLKYKLISTNSTIQLSEILERKEKIDTKSNSINNIHLTGRDKLLLRLLANSELREFSYPNFRNPNNILVSFLNRYFRFIDRS